MKMIACGALRDEALSIAGDIEVEFCEGCVHDHPDVLRSTLEERIAATPGDSTILLLYGRCCNGTVGLHAGSHRLVLPAIDDCISLLLGSRERYVREFSEHPGTYYYTRGWIEEVDDPYQIYLKLVPKSRAARAALADLVIASPGDGEKTSRRPPTRGAANECDRGRGRRLRRRLLEGQGRASPRGSRSGSKQITRRDQMTGLACHPRTAHPAAAAGHLIRLPQCSAVPPDRQRPIQHEPQTRLLAVSKAVIFLTPSLASSA